MPSYRKIEPADDARIAEIVRANLKHFHLDIPGTAYFDPELEHLSAFYDAEPSKRRYFVALDDAGQVVGGAGIAEFKGIETARSFRSCIWTIPRRARAAEKS